jgi:hypothetical protein
MNTPTQAGACPGGCLRRLLRPMAAGAFSYSSLVDASFPGAVDTHTHTYSFAAPGAASEVGLWQ